MRLPIPISRPSVTKREIEYVNDALKSGWISSLGKYIPMFEEKFARYCGTKFAVATSNGTVALHLALVAFGIGEGDEVIVPDLTFVATANAVKYTGATVVAVDIEATTLCIDPDKVRQAITDKTKAIIPVDLYGHPADMKEISKIAEEHDVLVIEDAAEAHGAEVRGRKVGSLGDCAIFSFYGNKIITSGEGGMITTHDEAFFERARRLRDHAMSKEKRYWHAEIGFNYRITNLQAALGVAQLERIDEILQQKMQIFRWYKDGLSDFEGVKLNYCADWAKNVYWMICLEIEGFAEGERDSLIAELREAGVDTRPYFYPLSELPMYKNQKYDTPVTHSVYSRGVTLPTYYGLSEVEVREICIEVKKAYRQVRRMSELPSPG